MLNKKINSEKVFSVFNYIFLAVILFLTAYPLYYILIASISNPYDVYAGETFFLPSDVTFVGYQKIFEDDSLVRGILNSVYYTVLGTFVSVVLIILTAYALSKKTLPGRKYLTIFFIITMYFGGGLIPTYLVVRDLDLINSVWAIILPGQVAVFNVIISRTFFENSIPSSLIEAAYIDGANNFRTFWSIVLPLSKSIIAVMVVFSMVGYWNDWFQALIYLPDADMAPLQLVLRQILFQSQAGSDMMSDMTSFSEQNKITELIKFASIIIASVPMLVVYPFVQKHFEKGVMIGSVKG